MINKQIEQLFVFLPLSVLLTILTLVLTSCSEVNYKDDTIFGL